jgi:F-type H+-transporting ATPase subunit delta
MISETSHIQYANALHRVAAKAKSEDRVMKDLDALKDFFADEKFKAMLKRITHMERNSLQKILVETFGGKVDPVTLNLLVLLARGRKLNIIPKIFDAYSNIFHTSKNICEIKICTARSLDSEEELQIIDKLQQKLDKPVSVRFRQDAKLIGGIQIYERGYLTDLSVLNYLATLKKHLMAID